MTTGALAVTAPHVRVEPFSGRAGATVTVSGGGFPANTPIYVALIETRKASEPLSLEQMQAAATTDERGSYSVRLVIPAIWPDGTLIPAGQLTVVAATADRRTWASVPCDYLGNALPTPLTATPVPPAIASPKPTLTQTPSAPLPEGDTTKVTICHRPPGNPRNARSITIDQSAVPAHLGHGDTLGGCAENGAGASKQDKDKHEATEKEKDKEKEKEKGKNK
jgi:hypothetical protein